MGTQLAGGLGAEVNFDAAILVFLECRQARVNAALRHLTNVRGRFTIVSSNRPEVIHRYIRGYYQPVVFVAVQPFAVR